MSMLLLAAAAHAATLDDLAWLVGTWRGQDGPVVYEERWHPPLGGAMMGTFRLAKGDAVGFYELMTLTAAELRIKHFGPELFGWEKRKEVTAFTVAEADATHAIFAAKTKRLVYTRAGEALEVRLEEKDHTATFTFTRTD